MRMPPGKSRPSGSGDRDWISLDELLAAINEGRRRTTVQAMQNLSAAVENYRTTNGALPKAGDIVALSDMLHPSYMSVLVREDGWGNPLVYRGQRRCEFPPAFSRSRRP